MDSLISSMKLDFIPEIRSYPKRAFPDDPHKRQMYEKLIDKSYRTHDLTRGPFLAMVKSGEVYTREQAEDSEYYYD